MKIEVNYDEFQELAHEAGFHITFNESSVTVESYHEPTKERPKSKFQKRLDEAIELNKKAQEK